MSVFLVIKGGKIELKPDTSWAWDGFDGKTDLDGGQSLLNVKGKPVVIETDFPQTQNSGKNYTTRIHSTPGMIQSIQLLVDNSTLSTEVFSKTACVTEKTEGTFQATVIQPALTPKGDPDLVVLKNGKWQIVECGEEIMSVEAIAPQSLSFKNKETQIPAQTDNQDKVIENGSKGVKIQTEESPINNEKSSDIQSTKQEPKIIYGPKADKIIVSDYTKQVLLDVLKKSGNKKAIITNTARDAYNQARVMYNNSKKYGVASQKELYGQYGDKVIDIYESSKKAGKTPEQIIKEMESKINEIGSTKVSKHAVDPRVLGVIDVAPSSIVHKHKFLEALQKDKRVSKIEKPPKDPAYHIEIPQPQSSQD
jgi:hypothetical protein